MFVKLVIAVVEDNQEFRESEVEVLEQIGHTVYGFESVEDYLDECGSFVADLLIVDLNLPGESGLNLVARLRETSRNIGIIIVSARSTTYQREEGYDYGADIYLVKPLSLHELCAAVASLGRRLHPMTEESGVITVDMKSRMMTGLTKVAVQLRSSEVALLVAFSLAPEHKLQNWQMYDVVGCGLAQDPKSALELVIVKLRKKLAGIGVDGQSINVIRNFGYQLVPVIHLI
jgi:DNA-binding response OmpR family regulator